MPKQTNKQTNKQKYPSQKNLSRNVIVDLDERLIKNGAVLHMPTGVFIWTLTNWWRGPVWQR